MANLNYLATCGDTLDEAFAMAADCLAGYLRWLQKDGESAPAASSVDQIELDEFLEEATLEAFVHMVTVDVDEYAREYFEESIKKMVVIPTWLYRAALEQEIDFSQTLQDALTSKLCLNKK